MGEVKKPSFSVFPMAQSPYFSTGILNYSRAFVPTHDPTVTHHHCENPLVFSW